MGQKQLVTCLPERRNAKVGKVEKRVDLGVVYLQVLLAEDEARWFQGFEFGLILGKLFVVAIRPVEALGCNWRCKLELPGAGSVGLRWLVNGAAQKTGRLGPIKAAVCLAYAGGSRDPARQEQGEAAGLVVA